MIDKLLYMRKYLINILISRRISLHMFDVSNYWLITQKFSWKGIHQETIRTTSTGLSHQCLRSLDHKIHPHARLENHTSPGSTYIRLSTNTRRRVSVERTEYSRYFSRGELSLSGKLTKCHIIRKRSLRKQYDVWDFSSLRTTWARHELLIYHLIFCWLIMPHN